MERVRACGPRTDGSARPGGRRPALLASGRQIGGLGEQQALACFTLRVLYRFTMLV